ncbi:hypothetical protein N825_12800 [Skermanella stibiiresistens SB22]|uniref:Spermidine synthase n=1 Tax=Skermanella stibiiresistens SB22 TaxID=1385369 RepID=W9H0L0_9PROT|nr:hypothetical protein [Skermanella stibiiresistens]EWY38376.1 hypothetical protein N825_12800 [Skermanella stibiiresistens SB22]
MSVEAPVVPAGLIVPGGAPLYAPDVFRPVYRPIQGERWRLDVAPLSLCPGYWSGVQVVTDMAVLTRIHGEGADAGLRTWMSMTPMEIESQELGCRAATGHTVVMGLGMGWAAANAALQRQVTAVTVVEFDPEVIGLIAELGVFAQLPPEATAKITVVEGDAFAWTPEIPADTLLADIWIPLDGDGRVAQVQGMRANTGASKVYFWGQEMVIARRAQALGLPLDTATVARIVAEMDLPLIGPEVSDYPDKIERAADRWLRRE